MKRLLIATAALSLIGGAAFAQTTGAQTTGAQTTGADTAGASAGQTPDMSAPATGASTASSGSTATMGSTPNTSVGDMSTSTGDAAQMNNTAPASTSDAATSGAPATTGATASNATPESYPVCTSKHEDHCVNRAQATRSARLATRHQKTDNVQPSGM